MDWLHEQQTVDRFVTRQPDLDVQCRSPGNQLGGFFSSSGSSNNLIQISSNGLLTNFSGVTIGGDSAANSNNSLNQLIVTNGGVAVNNVGNAINIGRSTNNNSNSLIVTGPGSLFNAGSGAILVGAPTNNGINYGNYVQVANGGVLSNAGTITVDNSNSYVRCRAARSMPAMWCSATTPPA